MHSKNSVLFLLSTFLTVSLVAPLFASAQLSNIFVNPSAETGTALPNNWHTDHWGGTKATFAYHTTGGQDGARYLSTEVTKKGEGDAKWYPTHVTVTPGEQYTFSDWYKSDITSGIDIEYVLSNGKYKYVHLATLKPADQWKQFTATFIAPARAQKMTVLHYISKKGTLSVDNYSLVAASTPPPPPQTKILSVLNASEVPSQEIGVNIPNQPLGGFTVMAPDEAVSVPSLTFFIATTSSTGLLTLLTLVNENGAVVAGPIDATYDPITGKQKLTFNDVINFPAGAHTFILKGKVPSTFAAGGTLTVSTKPSADWGSATGLSTAATIELSTSTVVMNTMSVSAPALTFRMMPMSAQHTVAGVSAYTFGQVALDATGSSEDVRISSIPLSFIGATGLSGCQLFDGAVALNTASRVVNTLSGGGPTNFAFDNVLHISKNTSKTLTLKCNISVEATDGSTYQFGVTNTYPFTATGDLSGATFSPTNIDSMSGTITVSTASLSISVDASSPASTTVAAGTTGQTLAVFKLRASNDDISLTKIGLKLGAGSAVSVTSVMLYNGATQIGSAVFGAGQTEATATLATSLVLPHDQDVKITAKVDVTDIGSGKAGIEGAVVKLVPLGAEGNASTGTVYAMGSGDSSGIRIYNSLPFFMYSTTGGSPTNGINDLLTLSVSANTTGDIGLYKLNFSVATSSVTLAAPMLIGPNGSVGEATLNETGNVITVTFNNSANTADATVSAGATKTYTLRGTINGLGVSGSVSVALKADPSASAITTAFGVSPNNIVWSPLATTSLDLNTDDWTNGYALAGCFAINGLGNDCQARVLSQ